MDKYDEGEIRPDVDFFQSLPHRFSVFTFSMMKGETRPLNEAGDYVASTVLSAPPVPPAGADRFGYLVTTDTDDLSHVVASSSWSETCAPEGVTYREGFPAKRSIYWDMPERVFGDSRGCR